MTREDIAHWIQQQDDELEYDPDGIEESHEYRLSITHAGEWSITFTPRPIFTQIYIAEDVRFEVEHSRQFPEP